MTSLESLRFVFTSHLLLAGKQWRQLSQGAIVEYGISAASAGP